jgi:sugar lactone lactonase YvrE
MSPSGKISFFAGNYEFAGDVVNSITNNDGTISRFTATTTGMGMTVDSAGTVYLADTGNHKVKKIWSSGRSTSMAGVSSGFANGTGGSAQFDAPRDVAVDHQGNVYVADTGNNRIRKIGESGVVTTLAGTGTGSFVDGDGATATFTTPSRIVMDPSNNFFYVMDAGNAAIRKVMTSGQTSTFCSYNVPTGVIVGDICVDNSGFLYILEKV